MFTFPQLISKSESWGHQSNDNTPLEKFSYYINAYSGTKYLQNAIILHNQEMFKSYSHSY